MWNYLKIMFIRMITKPTWMVVESHTAVWNIAHGKAGMSQDFIFYTFEYSPELGEYRLSAEGEKPFKHRAYGDMLSRLASLNTGTAGSTELYPPLEQVLGEIIITNIPLTNKPEEVWKLMNLKNKDLKVAIDKHKDELKKEGVEIFDQRGNIIATDIGYFGAFYENDPTIIAMLNDTRSKRNDNNNTNEQDEE